MSNVKESTSKKARLEYGPEALDVTADVCEEDLEKAKNSFLDSQINIDSDTIEKLEESTRDQSHCEVWKEERKKRLTSSNFGKITKCNPNIKVKPLVTSMLYSHFSGNLATAIGLVNEPKAKEDYMKIKGDIEKIEPMGLIVSKEHKFLAASPDGKVVCNDGDTGLIEIKNILYNKQITLTQAATLKTVSNFCLQMKDGKLQLKQQHNYYYQCQGLLNISHYDWLDFVVRTENPYEIHIERIFRDEDFWVKILPKLTAFYFRVILPELAVPREGKYPGIREPGLWFNKSHTKTKAKRKKGHSALPQKPRTEQPSTSNWQLSTTRTRREQRTKCLGRRIKHQWLIDGPPRWYKGHVVSIINGQDGVDAAYEVLYDNEEETTEINHLIEDFKSGEVTFIDL